MAKKANNVSESQQRQTRKAVLQARKEQQQKRGVYTAVAVVGGLLLVLFLVAVINELFISPNRPVAEVAGDTITLGEWQERVRFERAQRIVLLENQLESFDMSTLQQFYGQIINELRTDIPGNAEQFGSQVLNAMTEDQVVLQAAAERGITVTDEEVDERIAESFNYFGGQSPTPFPTPTETIMPTPSITPLPTAVITELVPTNTPAPTFTPGPTGTPPPTATPVTQAAFQEEFDNLVADYRDVGISETQFREFVRMQIYREKLADALAEEQELATEAPHASFFFLAFETEAGANEALALIEEEGFVPVWNQYRSLPPDLEAETAPPVASEVLWRTAEAVESSFGSEVATRAFSLPVETASGVLTQAVDEETNRYFILYVTGRETRPLSESALQQAKSQALTSFIDSRLTGNLTFTDYDKGRAPETPRLDPSFYLVEPTPTPPLLLTPGS